MDPVDTQRALTGQGNPSDENKINFMIWLLRGRALAWAQAASSRERLGALPFKEFAKCLERMFDRHARCASDWLFSLRQGARSIAEYAVEFGTLAVESGWNDPALQSAFK